jgi:hypothetical protein
MKHLLVILVTASACSSPPRPAPAAPEAKPAAVAAGPTPKCDDDGRTVWDATADECRLNPGYGWGHAGCSMRKTPAPAPGKCITGTHWESCGCECDKGVWNEDIGKCE